MFTLEQTRAAHAKVKSGADFPAYIRELKTLGVSSYTTYVADGHNEFTGTDGSKLVTASKYEPLTIAPVPDDVLFRRDLRAHQQGASDYFTFCQQAAAHGVQYWVVRMDKMTCTYFAVDRREVLVEVIP